MNNKSKLFLALGLLVTLFISYLFIPSGTQKTEKIIIELEAPFLQTDPRWADSVLQAMSDEEKLAQLFIPDINPLIINDSFELNFKESNAYGFAFIENDIQKQIQITKKVNEKNEFPVFFSSRNCISPFTNNNLINEEVLFAISDTAVKNKFLREYIDRNNQYGINFLRGFNSYYPTKNTKPFSFASLEFILPFIREANDENILFACGSLTETFDIQTDSIPEHDSIVNVLKQFTDSGMTVLLVDSSYYEWKKNNNSKPSLITFAEDRLDFKGLIAVDVQQYGGDEKNILGFFLQEGVDLFFTGNRHFKLVEAAKQMLKEKIISAELLNKKVRKILLAKSWNREKSYPTNERLENMVFYNDPYQKSIAKKLIESSFVLLKNSSAVLPLVLHPEKLPTLIEIGEKSDDFIRESSNYTKFRQVHKLDSLNALKKFNFSSLNNHHTIIVCLYNQKLDSSNSILLKSFSDLQKNKKIIVINFNNKNNLDYLAKFNTLLHHTSSVAEFRKSASRAVFGADAITGKSNFISAAFPKSKTLKLEACRLKYGAPEEVGIPRDSLYQIDYIMEEGIRNRAFPGGQVFLALNGTIIYHKSFGHHTYDRKTAVKDDHYFDMASVTKVAATTLMAMHLYEKKKYRLDDSLYRYLPDTLDRYLNRESTIKNITFRELLIHASGLPAGQNIFRFLRFNEPEERYDLYYCDEKSNQFDIDVADSFYIDHDCLDTLWIDLNKIWLDPNKPYCYSDANMNLLYTMLRPMIGKQKWDRYLDSVFYSHLGMKNTTFNPLKKKIEKEKIAPTEEDRYWRKDLLQGHVHDPTAALYGGVAGNAGLFSNAHDMGIFCQLLLNKGFYGGIRFFESKTVELFTSQQNGTHRGLGFNRQVSGNTYGCSPYASDQTYGHTGFTGTAFWVDPKLKFIFVFITNRVHPNPENKKIIQLGTTKRVHNVVYELLQWNTSEEQPI